MQKMTPFLWFDANAEDATNYYVSVFKNARVVRVARHGKQSAAATGQPEGSAMTVAYELDGQKFVAINGGPHFKISEAVSFVVNCESRNLATNCAVVIFSLTPTPLPEGAGLFFPLPPGEGPRVREDVATRKRNSL